MSPSDRPEFQSPLGGADVLERIARTMRRQLYAGTYRCVASFLHDLAERCKADEAGIVAIHKGTVTFRRASGSKFIIRDSDEYQQMIAQNTKRHAGDYAHYVLVDDAKALILRRIWPLSSWLDKQGEEVWLYVLNPFLVIPRANSPTDLQIANFGALASTFIRWKHEIFCQHDELLAADTADPDFVVEQFRKLVIRPLRPKDYFDILNRFRFTLDGPEHEKPFRWARYLWQFERACVRPPQCVCPHADDGGPKFPCPQIPHDNVVRVLTKLMLWRTEFWKVRRSERTAGDDWKELLATALDGLKAAADDLKNPAAEHNRPIDFTEGFAGGYKGERTLLRFFCCRAIEMTLEKLRDCWEKKGNDHATELEFPARLAELTAHVLGDGKWTPEAIENLLEVVALFGHRVLDIPGRIDLVRHLKETLRGESALHTLKSRYRDHFFHTLEVCFLGFALLESRPDAAEPKETFADRLVARCAGHCTTSKLDSRFAPRDRADLLKQWWTAALIHDTAYGIDILGGTLGLLEFFTCRNELKTVIEETKQAVGKFAATAPDVAAELKGDPSLKKGDHGLIAAASLNEALKLVGKKTRKQFQPAVRAIAFHNTRFPRVDAGRDPVAALLILCDTLQEWGRSSLRYERSPAVMLSRLMEAAATPAEEQLGPVKRYGISLEQDGGAWAWADADKLRIELDYGPEVLKECRAKFTWADTTYNLQRVDYRPWGVEIGVQVSVPPPEKPKAGGKPKEPEKRKRTQFEYFGDFIAEQQVRILEEWYRVASRNNPKEAVRYFTANRDPVKKVWVETDSPEGACELIALDLHKLSERFFTEDALMGGHVGNFNEAMKAWSDYATEQGKTAPAQHPPH